MFDARKALRIGLVDEVVPKAHLDAAVDAHVQRLLECGPAAQALCKELIRHVSWNQPEDMEDLTARTIARARASAEGREGVGAFLEKREPSWRAGGAG